MVRRAQGFGRKVLLAVVVKLYLVMLIVGWDEQHRITSEREYIVRPSGPAPTA
jgi:hypothetical protein